MTNKIATLILICLSISLCFSIVNASIGEFDKVAVVTRVIDGDTFDIDSGDRIRFADVNTPESGEVGYQEAKDYVAGLVEGKTVYLDIDDKYTTDTTGTRLVAVIYLGYNSTHYMNLNKALLQNHYATIWDHDNEFNPSNWSLFESKTTATPNPSPTIPEFPELMIITAFILLLLASAIMLKVKNNKQR
jgi:endonuclease YncB( thermonuclease family)